MNRVWVADTCALLEVRRCIHAPDGNHARARKGVFEALDKLVASERLLYPKEVWSELKKGNAKLSDPTVDHAFQFVERHKDVACVDVQMDIVHELMQDTLVRRVLDPDAEDDEADIYVLSVAVAVQRVGHAAGVITQERRDLPKKCSVSTACGHLGIPSMPMPAFLHSQGIWALYA